MRTRRRAVALDRDSPAHWDEEIIARILVCIQQIYLGLGQLYTSSPQDIRGFYYYRQWTRVTRVCRRWRDIALSSQSLWNIIPLEWEAFAIESLKRLGSDAPFFLVATGHASTWIPSYRTPLWSSIAANCHRIRFIRGSNTLANLEHPMPLLEHTEISRCDLSNSLCVISPALHTLVLSQCRFSWDWPALPLLTTLNISSPTQKVFIHDFAKILKNSPLLKVLQIHDIFPAFTQFQLDHEAPPLSPKLSSFHASGSPLSLNLLTWLRFSDTFTIDMKGLGPAPVHLSPLLDPLVWILLESTAIFRCLSLERQEFYSARGEFVELALQERQQDQGASVRLLFSLLPGHDLNRWVKNLAILPLDQLERLSTNVVMESATWRESGLGQLPKLCHLNVHYCWDAFFTHIIGDYDASKTQGKLSFASLEVVEAKSFNPQRDLTPPLRAALAGRKEAGSRLKILYS
ncbi:hypothetical protein BDN72DRAFT_846860 [Pluteus cervinus]|uniref:Uncharacterized protein n=1 Tax=Pluteus cervinus TaxID=181527 RepID=A0ACD3AEH2_9AGAR|nr:hypothetical protein BDN72DRAFT_846860 [Pluteus cervinus]